MRHWYLRRLKLCVTNSNSGQIKYIWSAHFLTSTGRYGGSGTARETIIRWRIRTNAERCLAIPGILTRRRRALRPVEMAIGFEANRSRCYWRNYEKTGRDRISETASWRVESARATGLYLFGLTARDDAGSESDLDLLVDYDRSSRFSLVELVGIKQFLERRLGVHVDLTTRDSPNPLLNKDRIEASAELRLLTERLVRHPASLLQGTLRPSQPFKMRALRRGP